MQAKHIKSARPSRFRNAPVPSSTSPCSSHRRCIAMSTELGSNFMQDNQILSARASADDWLARDLDVETPVYLVVQSSPGSSPSRDARSTWSIAWPVGDVPGSHMPAWRYISLINSPANLADGSTEYKYRGPLTKTECPGPTSMKYILAKTSLATREKIQQLALANAVASDNVADSDDRCDVRAWFLNLLDSLVTSGLISGAQRDLALMKASD
ncbi:hypothetical protein BD414DRAFT_486595 [Trametes punicea]|nr:hypothetical protein BD414DRAFT_486595 [Trametes punicea]